MSTFYNGSAAMLASVAILIDKDVADDVDVHTITLVMSGRHGEFDLRVEGTDEDFKNVVFEGVAHRSGGVSGFKRLA